MRGNSDSLWYLTDQPVVQPPDPERNHPTQQEEVGEMKGLKGTQRMLVEFLLKHKGHGSEQAGLRQACLSPKWDDTNPSATAPWSRASSPRPVIATRPIGKAGLREL